MSLNTTIVSDSDESSLCRLCAKNHGNCVNIFIQHGAFNLPVEEVIRDLISLKVVEGDGLPCTACLSCVGKLMELKDFKEMCLMSDIELRKSAVGSNFKCRVKEETVESSDAVMHTASSKNSDSVVENDLQLEPSTKRMCGDEKAENSDGMVPVKVEVMPDQWLDDEERVSCVSVAPSESSVSAISSIPRDPLALDIQMDTQDDIPRDLQGESDDCSEDDIGDSEATEKSTVYWEFEPGGQGMEWIIVKFLKNSECKAVPIDWVEVRDKGDSKCLYPPDSTPNREMLSLLKGCQFPLPGWQLKVCQVFERLKTDNYIKALELEIEAKMSSGLDACRSLGRGMRKKRKVKLFDDEEEPPVTVFTRTHGSSSSDKDNGPGKVSPCPRTDEVRQPMLSTPDVSVDVISPQSGKQQNPQVPDGKVKTKRPATVEGLHEAVQALEQLWEGRYRRFDEKLNLALSMLSDIKKEMKSKHAQIEDGISINRRFPLKNLDEVEELERELSEDLSLHNNLVSELTRHCGDEEQSSVYKILYFVMEDEAARHFCLTGKSGVEGVKKRKFMGTKIYNVLMDVFSRKPGLSRMSVSKIEKKMGEWFRQTGTRMRRFQLKSSNEVIP